MKEGCGDMGRVGEDDVESSKQSMRQACANDSKASRHDGRSDTCRHQRCRVAVKRRRAVLMVWSSKPSPVAGFPIWAAKLGADLAQSRFERRACGAIEKLASE